jgi:dUTPase
MKEIEVQYLEHKDLIVPTQGYEDDFAYDIYASEGRLVHPSAFKSVAIPTQFKTAFDPKTAGMKVALRSGIAANTPLIISNAIGIIEGTYRGGANVLVRNTFIDSSHADFVFSVKGERIPLHKVPNAVKKNAREFFEDELELLGYSLTHSDIEKKLFRETVPRGTIYVEKGDRIAQIYFSPKINAKFNPSDELPDSERGEGKFGSSGTK